jgi:malate dehydrogenase
LGVKGRETLASQAAIFWYKVGRATGDAASISAVSTLGSHGSGVLTGLAAKDVEIRADRSAANIEASGRAGLLADAAAGFNVGSPSPDASGALPGAPPSTEVLVRAPIHVAVTGAAGNIGYALLWRLANGECFGADQPIVLRLLEIPAGMEKLHGTVLELQDSAFPLLHGIVATDDVNVAFEECSAAFLVGSRPRTKDMDRADLVRANGPIFTSQGRAIAERSRSDVKVVVVGNPCNTNALIAAANAKGLSADAFSAMTRLDENRAVGQLAIRAGVTPDQVKDVFIWGNHADTMYPDISLATVAGKRASEVFDAAWIRGEFLNTVATRGKAVIVARGASSAASAASAASDHMRDWYQGSNGRIVSMAIPSKGWYGVPEGLVFSFPCTTEGGRIQVVEGVEVDDFAQMKIDENVKTLAEERDAVRDLL